MRLAQLQNAPAGCGSGGLGAVFDFQFGENLAHRQFDNGLSDFQSAANFLIANSAGRIIRPWVHGGVASRWFKLRENIS
jgi:hypothetical protein